MLGLGCGCCLSSSFFCLLRSPWLMCCTTKSSVSASNAFLRWTPVFGLPLRRAGEPDAVEGLPLRRAGEPDAVEGTERRTMGCREFAAFTTLHVSFSCFVTAAMYPPHSIEPRVEKSPCQGTCCCHCPGSITPSPLPPLPLPPFPPLPPLPPFLPAPFGIQEFHVCLGGGW